MSQTRRSLLAGMAATTIARPASAAQPARLIDRRWARFGSLSGPDHGAWDALLRRHLRLPADKIARFDYGGANPSDVAAYVAAMEAVDPATLTAPDAFAYWVNLYNAVTVLTVLRNAPVRSIRDIRGGIFSRGPWRKPLTRVAGQALSLDDIEHGILRPVFREQRVHYAVNCAALGCPNLQSTAWTADRLPTMLDSAARAFVNHPRGARVSQGRLTVSSIYHWFRSDFGGSDTGVIAHLRSHAAPAITAQLAPVRSVSGHGYDWRLNSL